MLLEFLKTEATARPWAFRQLEALAPLVGQGLFRFGIEALLGVAQEADRALAAIRAIALADVPGLFDQTLEVLAGVSFLGPEAGCHLTLEEPDADVGSPLDRHRCASCAGDPAPAAAGEGPRREAGVELPIRSPRGDGFGRLSVCDPSGRTRSWQELEFLQAVSETLGTAIERRRAEEKATAGEARYRRIVENCAEAIAKLDPEGRFTFANGRLAELLGVPADRLLGESVWRFVGDEDRAEAEAIFGRLRHGGTERVDFRLRRADGTLLQTQVSAVGLTDAEGRPRGFLGMITDLTQHRRAEEMLRQAQKMEALGHLARGIAHDFNNLLSVILGTADVLRRELPEGDPHGEDLDEIRDAGRRAARLTKQLLAFARADRGTPELVEPDHAVAGMEGLLRNAIGETVALELDLEAEPWSIRIDPGYLEQVLVNLAVNAREAMPGGGTLAIATRKLPGRPLPSIPGPGNWVELRVRDTGRGIPPDDLPRIFEPFFTTKEKGRGSGLGLPTVFGIVEQAGGKIAIDSEPGRGTTVTAWLPAAPIEAEEAAPPGTPRPPRAAAGETILVAEDEVAIRSLARRVLEGHGYRVLEAGDGERALAVLCGDAERVDLLLADVVMPRMSATELLERLPADRRPAVLLMSGYGGDVAPASDEPRAGFLAKPFTAVGLLEAVGRVLGPVRSAVESPGQ
jgi:PAS domain S-box-containing protein